MANISIFLTLFLCFFILLLLFFLLGLITAFLFFISSVFFIILFFILFFFVVIFFLLIVDRFGLLIFLLFGTNNFDVELGKCICNSLISRSPPLFGLKSVSIFGVENGAGCAILGVGRNLISPLFSALNDFRRFLQGNLALFASVVRTPWVDIVIIFRDSEGATRLHFLLLG